MGQAIAFQGGPGTGSGAGPAPAASNVSAASVTANYGLVGNASAYGFSGSVALPTASPSYHQPKFIHAVVTLPDGSTDELCPAMPAGTTTFQGPVKYLEDGSGHSVTIRFLCENEDGAVTASPYSVTVTVNASAVTGVTGREVPSTLTVDPVTRLVSTTIGGTPTLANNQVLQNVTYLLSDDNGSTFIYIGWKLVTSVGQEIQLQRVKPSNSQTWKLAMVAGAVGGDPSKRIPAAQLPAGAVVSAGFTVGALVVPATTLISTLTISAGAGGTFPYNQQTPDGTQYFSIPQISLDDSGCVSDANAFYIRVTAQDLDTNHNPLGPEQPFDGAVVNGSVHTFGPLAGAYGTNGFSYTRSANIAYVRLKVYVCNRVDQSASSFSNPACATLQTGVGSGAGYVDATVASGGAIPTGALAGSRVVGKLSGSTLPLGSDNTLSLDGSGNIIVNQPAVVISNLSGNLNVSRVSSLNTIAVSSFSGNLDVSRVSSLNTVAVSSFTGNLDVSRVNNLYTLYIWGFTGNLDVSRVTNLGTLYIANFTGNLDVSRVTNLTTLSLANFSGNLDVSRVTNLGTLSISSFTGNLDISRVSNIASINIGTLSGTLNVTYQIADGSIPINKIATLYVNNIQGWNGASINVGGSGLQFTGTAGISLFNGGGIVVNPGVVNAAGGYYVGTLTNFQCIYQDGHANFTSLQIQGGTRIDASANAFFANIYRNGSELGGLFAAKGTYNVYSGGTVVGTVTI